MFREFSLFEKTRAKKIKRLFNPYKQQAPDLNFQCLKNSFIINETLPGVKNRIKL